MVMSLWLHFFWPSLYIYVIFKDSDKHKAPKYALYITAGHVK